MREWFPTPAAHALEILEHLGFGWTALDNHVLWDSPKVAHISGIGDEAPRRVFLHYWGVGPVGDLAKGLKAALDTQKTR
jgi:hypothetical protein